MIYSAGTAAVTANSATVTGNGTSWALNAVAGGTFHRGAVSVPIRSVESDTSLTLEYAWPGANGAAAAYAISQANAEAASATATLQLLAERIRLLKGISPAMVDVVSKIALADARASMGADNADNLLRGTLARDRLAAGVLPRTASQTDAGTDWNAIVASGWHPRLLGTDNANSPMAGQFFWCEVIHHTDNDITQIAYPFRATGLGSWTRLRAAGTWGPWRRQFVERGSNANGNWVRFPDGSQICRSPVLSLAQVNANRIAVTWSYPAPFVGTPSNAFTLTALGNLTNAMLGSAMQIVDSATGSAARYSLVGPAGGAAFASDSRAEGRLLAYGEWQ